MIEIKDLCFSYGERTVFFRLNLILPDGIVCISGDSGRGKTTLLRLIAGLERPDSGSISGVPERPVFMFQDDRLLPWLTAEQNIASVLPPEEKKRAKKYLEAVELSEFAESFPAELSGGQCRRVSLARALAFGGGILLLDEPFTGLDPALSARMAWLVRNSKKNAIVVTHSQADIEALGGKMIEI